MKRHREGGAQHNPCVIEPVTILLGKNKSMTGLLDKIVCAAGEVAGKLSTIKICILALVPDNKTQ